MANSIYKVHEMINKVGFEFDDATAKKVAQLAEKAGQMAAQNMTKELSVIVTEMGNIFNQALTSMGKQPIDLTDMLKMPDSSTIANLTNNFVSRITGNIAAGVGNSITDVTSQIAALEAKKAELYQQNQKLDKRYSKFEHLSELSSMDYSEFKPLSAEDDLDAQAQRIMGEFIQAEDALNELTRGTKEYNTALIKALEAADNLYRMAQTLNQNKGAVKDQTLLSDYSMLSLSDTTADIFEKADTDFAKFFNKFDQYYMQQMKSISAEIDNIDAKITTLKANNPEIINEGKAKSALKTLEEIEAAYGRLTYKTGKNKGQLKAPEQIDSALNYVPGTESLTKLKNAYMKADPERWEQQYVALVKFVREYEAYLNMMNAETDSHQRSKMKDRLGQYTELYQQLQPMAANAESMLQNILNMADGKSFIGISGDKTDASSNTANEAEREAQANQASAEAEAKARTDAEAKAKADAEAAAATEKEKLAQEEATRAAKEKTDAVAKTVSLLQSLYANAGTQTKEHMSLMNTAGMMNTVNGAEYAVDTATLVNQLIGSLKSSILMSLHNHPDGMLAFTPSDIASYGKLYQGQGINIHSIIADGVIKTVDFTGVSREVILKIAQSFSQHLSTAAQNSNGLFNYEDGNINLSDNVQALMKSSPEAYTKIKQEILSLVNNALGRAFKDNGLASTVQDFTGEQLPQLAEYLLQVQQSAQNTISPVEKLKNLIASIKPNIAFDWNNYSDILGQFDSGAIDGLEAINQINQRLNQETQARQENTNAINAETQAQEKLNAAENQNPPTQDDTGAHNANAEALERQAQAQEQVNVAKSNKPSPKDDTPQINAETEALQQEVTAQERLNIAKASEPIDEDETAIIQAENGSLEQKLALLQDIAEQYGVPITQKTRDAYERLNQKDMDTGLTPAQEERFWELGETIDQADTNLMEFEQTYDRIVLKLANGKNISILPDDKGLRSLDKIASEYYTGEYNGVEIEDVKFERAKQVAEAEQQVTTEKQNQAQIEAELKAKEEEALRLAKEKADAERLAAEAKKEHEAQIAAAKAREEEVARLAREKADVEAKAAVAQKQQEQAAAAAKAQAEAAAKLALEKAQAEQIAAEALRKSAGVITTGTGTGTSGAGTTTPTQTVPDGAISAEATELEAVRAKVLEVTNAVNTKTQAFLNEQSAVKRVAQSEIHALGEVEKKVTTVRVALNNLQTKQHKINLSVAGGEDVSNISATETQALTKLRAALQLTTKRVDEKTQAFEAEKTVVNKVVNSEINALNRLNTQVGNVNKTVMTLLTNIQNVQTGASNIVAPQAQPAPQNNTGAKSKGSGGGNTTSPQLLNAKIDTQFSSLSLMYAQLESVGKLTPQIEQQWLQLWDSLSKVNDTSSLQLWREQLNQVRNSMKEIMIANNLVEQEGVQSFQQLIAVTRLYNKMAIGATKAKTPEERSIYEQEANNALVEQQRILQGITLTKEQQVQYGELIAQRQREINKIQAAQTGAENAKRQKQEEAIVVRELVELYEQLGRARAQGDYTTAGNIRKQIKTERGKLSTVDRATDDKFAQATKKGEQSVADEANKAATKAQNEALRERQKILGDLIRLHRELGVLEEKEKSSAVSDSKRQQYRSEIYDLYRQISAKEQLIVLTQEEVALLNQTHSNAGRSARISNAGEREAEINKLKGQYAKLGEAQANAEHKGTNEAKERFAVLAKEIAEKKNSLQLTQQELDVLRKIVAESYKKQSGILTKTQIDEEFKEQIKNAQREAGVTRAKSTESRAVDTMVQAGQIQGITPEHQANLDAYKAKILELKNTIANFPKDGVATEAQKNQLINQRLEVDAYTKEIQELIANYERLSGENAQVLGTSSLGLGASADAYQQELTQTIMAQTKGRAQVKAYDAETRTLTYTLKTGRGEFTQYAASVRQADGALVSVRGTTTKAMGVFESIGKKIKEYSYYFTGSMMIYRVIAWVREGITAVTEIDKALTELKKVTDETEASYDRFLDTASKTSEKLGTTIADFTQATATFAKLGYDMATASAMAEAATVYQNVGDGIESADAAAESIISTIKGFNLEASESMRIVDRFNEVGNRFSITSKGIGDALQRSASALSAAGNTLDESIGLITAANEVVQDPESVGTALKTLSLRLRGAKTELEEAGLETENMAETTATLQKKLLGLTGGKVDIMLDANTFKNTTEILREMSGAWEDMTDIQQAAALELMGGKRQAKPKNCPNVQKCA